MSDIIRLLPDSVANQIAAGEVIQRPSSVVKELVENAVDAGATDIQIIIRDAGRTLIQVVDNGCGMSDTDARMAFERHATSKIERADDLFSLKTMGFRGEALASIAAVSQVDVRTMLRGSDIGTRLLINGSHVESQLPEVCAPGCNIMVKNLFFNVPARRKFLKKDTVEFSNIMREFERLSLVNPNVDFTLIHNDAVLHKIMRSSLKQRITDLFGKVLDKQLMPVETDTSIVKITGFISRPEHARRRNPLQYMFVNGRNMRHPYFHKAVMLCYESLIAPDEQPNYFLNFTVDADTIDVNIHPTKNEIKFENEAAIRQILSAAVKETLGRFNAVPGIDFDSDSVPEIPIYNPNVAASHDVDIDDSYNPFVTGNKISGITSRRFPSSHDSLRDWDKLYEGFASQRDSAIDLSSATGSSLLNSLSQSDIGSADASDSGEPTFNHGVCAEDECGSIQLKNRYILSATKSGIMVIDQHRAHVRVLYEQYLAAYCNGVIPGQNVMFPEVIRLSPVQNAMLESMIAEISGLGFDISYLGDNSWSVNSVPSILDKADPTDTLLHIVDDALEASPEHGGGMCESIALSLAKSAAIKSGQKLSQCEREHLLVGLFKLTAPNYTPDGKLIINIIAMEDIERMF